MAVERHHQCLDWFPIKLPSHDAILSATGHEIFQDAGGQLEPFPSALTTPLENK